MNAGHRKLCRSEGWASHMCDSLIPFGLQGVELGPEVLEIGPGYGVCTEPLAGRVDHLTALELDRELAARLAWRMGERAQVVLGDGAEMPLPSDRFTGVVCFTMLHHVPSPKLQDRLFAEARRVLRPGGVFAGTDSRPSRGLANFHACDTYVPVDPGGLSDRLRAAGFDGVDVGVRAGAFRFRAHRPGRPGGGDPL